MTATKSTHPLGRGRALLVMPVALVLVAVPLLLFKSSGSALIDDTRAFFGAGTAQSVPTVSQVHCVGSRAGSSSNSSRSIGMTNWDCVIDLAAAARAPRDDPFKTMPYDQAFAEWQRRTNDELKHVTDPANRLNRIERSLATNRTGDIPTLRRLTPDGQPRRFGVVWGGSELAIRWARIALLTALFWGLAVGILYLARRIWRQDVR